MAAKRKRSWTVLLCVAWGAGLLLPGTGCASLSAEELMARGDQAHQQKKYKAARSKYDRYLDEYGGDRSAEAEFKIGRAYFDQGRWGLALRSFGEVLEEHSDSDSIWDALYYGGVAYGKLGRCIEASEWLGKLYEAGVLEVRGAKRYKNAAEKQLNMVNDDMSGAHRFCNVHTGAA